jgi:hypothetical protein
MAIDVDGPGAQWEQVGTIDTAQDDQVRKHIQGQIGLKASIPRIDGFYLHGSPTSPWVVRAHQHAGDVGGFWIAIDPLGDGSQYLVSTAQASVGTPARRAPEPHPGLRERPVTLAIKLRPVDRRLFDVHRHVR